MARPDPASDPLDRLISESEATLQRIENLKKGQSGQPASQRVVSHLTKHGSHIINLALAGCVFVVAYGQVTLKRKHEADLQAAEERLQRCREAQARVETQGVATSLGQEVLVRRIQQEIDSAGFRSRPVLQRIQGLLDEYRARTLPPASAAPHSRAADVAMPPAPAAASSQAPMRRPLI